MSNNDTYNLLTKKRDDALIAARDLVNEVRLYSAAMLSLDDEDGRCYTNPQHNQLVKALALIDSVMDDEWE
jgi:hypothetical protein